MFLLKVHAYQGARQKSLISVCASVELKRDEEPTLHDFLTRKY